MQILAHIVRECTAKKAVCPSCGDRGHTAPACTPPKCKCVNFRREHSAAYLGCPKGKKLIRAYHIRSSGYMPMAQARRMAHQELKHASQKT